MGRGPAVLAGIAGGVRRGSSPAPAGGGAAELEEFLGVAGDEEPALRARAHATLSEIASTHLRSEAAHAHVEAARELAEALDDPGVMARVEFVTGLERFGALDLDTALRHFRRSEERARDAGDTLIEAWALGRKPLVLWSSGHLDAAKAAADAVLRHDREHGWWGEYAFVAAIESGHRGRCAGNLAVVERLEVDAASAVDHGEMAGAAYVALARGRRRGGLARRHARCAPWCLDEWPNGKRPRRVPQP